jgi:hypothetical protein
VDRGTDDDVTAGQVTDDLARDDLFAPESLKELVLPGAPSTLHFPLVPV